MKPPKAITVNRSSSQEVMASFLGKIFGASIMFEARETLGILKMSLPATP